MRDFGRNLDIDSPRAGWMENQTDGVGTRRHRGLRISPTGDSANLDSGARHAVQLPGLLKPTQGSSGIGLGRGMANAGSYSTYAR